MLYQLPSVIIVRLSANVVSSSPAARGYFFMNFPLTHSVSFFFYIFWCWYRPCGLKGTVWDGDLATVLDWRELSDFELCGASVTKLATTPALLSWRSGLAVTICDNRAARP